MKPKRVSGEGKRPDHVVDRETGGFLGSICYEDSPLGGFFYTAERVDGQIIYQGKSAANALAAFKDSK